LFFSFRDSMLDSRDATTLSSQRIEANLPARQG
jgi:hypothetical protein